MMGLDRRTSSDAFKLLVFVVVTTLATAMLVVTIGNISFGSRTSYHAVFTDATGVVKGDDVRIAGVKVGVVEGVEIHEDEQARVTFSVSDATQLTLATHATIKFRNLVGQRYVALSQEVGGNGRLEAGETIPLDRTHPALDLTVLFNGFKPLFRALSPSDINQFSHEIIQVFQGEGGTLESLLSHTASVTGTLAARDQLIGDLIDNLNEVLVHIGDRDEQLTRLIKSFRTLVAGLKKDRDAILDPLEQISALSVETAQLVAGIRAPFVADIKALRRFAANLDKNSAEIDRALQVLPIKLEKVGRTAIYGSWFNFYLCEFQGRVNLPGGRSLPVDYQTGSARCDLS